MEIFERSTLYFSQERVRHFFLHQQNRIGQSLVDEDLRRADDLLLIAFREDDALRIALGAVVHRMHQSSGPSEELFQAAAVSVEVGNRLLRHAGFCGRARHRNRHVQQHAVIEWLGDQVLAPECEPIGRVCA